MPWTGRLHVHELRWTGGLLRRSLASRNLFRAGKWGHYTFIIPTLDMVIMPRTDNDPPVKDAKTITEIANRATPASQNRHNSVTWRS